MKNITPLILFIAIILIIDLYAFKSYRLVSSSWNNTARYSTFALYILSSLLTYGFIIYVFVSFTRDITKHPNYHLFYAGFGLLILILLPKMVVASFHLIDDILHLFKWVFNLFIHSTSTGLPAKNPLTRWQFISRLGWILAAVPFLGVLYGILRGRYAYRVERANLKYPNLPQSASGLKIVHISDIHIGSFFHDFKPVQRGIEMVNALEPDIICFTGDLVNNEAEEVKGWVEVLSALKAKYGKYSILGNHDYGDYVEWPSDEAKQKNLERLKAYHAELGFELLLNEWVPFVTTEGESFEIIGVQNWGKGGFSKYGDLAKALKGTNPEKFQLLMSHDPSHWDAEVLGDTKINLTLSGHTHGMQFGVEIPGLIKWSPIEYRYPRWGGLYTVKSQDLYVNRGFGFLGFPGRVGMPPEITLITLEKG